MIRKLIGTLLLLSAGIADAQQFFLLPESFSIRKGDRLVCRVYEGFDQRRETPLSKDMIAAYHWYNDVGKQDLFRRYPDRTLPALDDHANVAGLQLVAMEISSCGISLSNARLKSFLQSLYNDDLKSYRTKGGRKPEQIRVTNYLKTLAMASTASGTLFFKEIQQKLELTLLDNPYPACLGKTMTAQLYFEGNPLANASVEIFRKTAKGFTLTKVARTDKEGKIRFMVDKAGAWMLRSTHLQPAAAGADGKWNCLVACYTFDGE